MTRSDDERTMQREVRPEPEQVRLSKCSGMVSESEPGRTNTRIELSHR